MLTPTDFTLTPAQVMRRTALLAHWDAAPPLAPDPALAEAVLAFAFAVCAPRVPRLTSASAAAAFLRAIPALAVDPQTPPGPVPH